MVQLQVGRVRQVPEEIKKEYEMSHPRQEDDRRLGDNDEAGQEKLPRGKHNSPGAKGKVVPLEGRNNEGSEHTGAQPSRA